MKKIKSNYNRKIIKEFKTNPNYDRKIKFLSIKNKKYYYKIIKWLERARMAKKNPNYNRNVLKDSNKS